MTKQTLEEVIFLKDNQVLVTESRFVIGAKTYAMRNISSVSKHEVKESPKKTWGVALILIGLIVLIGSKLLGILMIAVGFFLVFSKEFCVLINSNSGEANELTSKDEKYVQRVVEAINDAIIHRK